MTETITGHTLRMIREEIEAPLRAEIERLKAALETCRELREYDRKEIERLKRVDKGDRNVQ